MNYKNKFYTVILFFIISINGFCEASSFAKDSTKTTEANSKKMLELQKMLDSIKIGNIAPDFRFISIQGDTVQLSSFRGKIVVIDFWATWCPPCLAQIPFYDTLKEKFKGKDIVFMSVSIDFKKGNWEKYVKKKNLSDIQLWSGSSKQAYYYTLMDYKTMERIDPVNANSSAGKKNLSNGISIFDGVPGNFVIIGKDGKIENNWLLPSNGHKMEDELNELLKE